MSGPLTSRRAPAGPWGAPAGVAAAVALRAPAGVAPAVARRAPASARISATRGIVAYRSTGLEPTRDRWSGAGPRGGAADGLAAVALAESGLPHDYLQSEWLRQTFGRDYVHGFGLGFGGHARPYGFPVGTSSPGSVLQGFDDGLRLWAAVERGVPDPALRA